MDKLVRKDMQKIFSLLKDVAVKNKEYYIELDSIMGDGDLGLTMASVFRASAEFAESNTDDIGLMIMKAGMAMAKAAPSTMGTLMATGFMRGGKKLKGVEEIDITGMKDFWKAFAEGIMERGKSKPGEKTIVDVLYPAAMAFEEAAARGADMAGAMRCAKIAAQAGVEATKNMVAQHGRAAYYQEKSRTLQDPGATVGSMVISIFSDYITDGDE
jgi:phosphoenolpyruvate---glycerone phosphotransferase subunit DhaL